MKTEEEKISKRDTKFLSSLGIVAIGRENIKKKELVGILRQDKEFQKEVKDFFQG